MKVINDHQRTLYERFSLNSSEKQLNSYLAHLSKFESRRNIKILDIGGATGHLAYLMKNHFEDNGCEVYVVDPTVYDTWDESAFGKDVNFICDSIENLKDIFEENSFDIIIANRVFHHFVHSSWRKSLKRMDEYMKAIHSLLKGDGVFCVMDHFYNGMIIDSASSFLIYSLTTIRVPAIAKFIKKMGAESAGVGTCFLSEKMWKKKITNAGFNIDCIERSKPAKLKLTKRLLMFKEEIHDNVIIASPIK